MSDSNPDGGVSIDTMVMDDKLAKIRSQITSKLENQKHLAIILSAVEENIEEQNNDKTPTAYFVSFLALLDQCIKDETVLDNNLATTTAYFLDLVFPFTPKPLLKENFSQILAKLAHPLTSPNSEAPLIRSTIGALESLLLAQDHKQWSSSGNISPRRAFLGLLELSFDPRPKVRRRAQEAVSNILSHPPASPSPVHAASGLAAEVSLNKLTSLLQEAGSQKKKNTNKELNSQIIHCLQLISSITLANSWPINKIEPLCDILLEISKTSDQYLVSSAFGAFEGLFKSMTNIIDVEKFARVLNIIFDLKPSVNDSHLAASWLAVIAKALESFAALSPETCIGKLPTILPTVAQFLASDSKDIYTSASQCLIAIVNQCIPDKFLLQPTADNGITGEIYELIDETVTFIAEMVEKDLFTIKYQHATKQILEFVTATILKLRIRANPDFLNILETVGAWRSNETDNFPHNKEAEDVIAASISTMGPQVVLSILPLNLTGGSSQGRAWLLPILRDNVKFAELQFYKTDILPVVEFFEDKIAKSTNKESMNVKIFQTIIDQIWSLLPHFCDLPKDLTTGFDDAFAAKLSDLMYAKVELRGPICHALRLLAESNLAYSEGAMADDLLMQQEFPIVQAKQNLEYLQAKSSNILSVLFNVFSATVPESRGFVLETVDTYLQIVPKEELANTFDKVCGLLRNAMDEEAANPAQQQHQQSKNETPRLSITMMDLIVAMAKFVPETSHNALFAIFSTTVVMKDNALLQKRSYRLISKLAESDNGKQSILKFIGDIENVLIQTTEITHNSARASRLQAISLILEILPPTDLYFIPAILQEIILATKDVNEKSRQLSYQILIQMGHKMSEGGIVQNSKVPGFDPSTPDSTANLTEYFTMVSAGLAAQAPHMISACITAISCLVFEFKDSLATETLLEIASTVELFLTHNSREIAKSAIGFVKVEVLCLPEDMVRSNLNELLAKLMKWSHEHKGHFKSKVKHILERLIRKFGIEAVEEAIPEEDKKLIANIRKTRNRLKKKQEEAAAAGAGTSADATQPSTGEERKFVSAYEQALYDSDSDEEDVEIYDEDKLRSKASQFILETGDEPLNLLDRNALAHISSSKPKKFTKADLSSKTADFKTKNGKLVFSEGASNDEDPLANKGSGIDAYLDAVKQAPVRGQRNKLKFKKQKNDEEDWSDDEGDVKEKSKFERKAGGKSFGKGSRVSKPKQKFKAKKKL